ncbi:minor tail protein [Microbacterium phage Margaery]|uniref:Minor tail protein n=1 Tax=Microbacterium phage Margaery TaxID=2591217 RepID=A0A514DHJ7_9CAUD|nr:minor tail protein [Microbacterium phage Margaery]QDH93090.1 minor tail protein [Microbacterium phage Margaery]
MADFTGAYSGRPNHYLLLRVNGNAPAVAWEAWAIRGSGSVSYALDCFTWNVGIFGYAYGGCHNLDFRSTSQILLASGSTPASGTGYCGANHLNASIFGSAYAEGYFTAATAPPPPNIYCISPNPREITQTEMTVAFCSTGDGGSPITSWALQGALDPGFTNIVFTTSSSGTTRVVGLQPGTTYYYRARGQNAIGVGGWSGTVSATTLPAVPPGMTVAPALSGQSATVTLTPPGGISGVTSYTVEYRLASGGAATSVTGASPIVVNGLTPGATYEWRALANFGSSPSPWTAWTTYFQPNPNTNPGNYFDGATADTADLDFRWNSTANNSPSTAFGKHATGWADFVQAAEVSGGSGAQYRVTGAIARYPEGQPAGSFSARYAFFGDANVAGFRAGTDPVVGGAEVSEGGMYWASIYVQPSRAQRLAAGISWYDELGNLVSRQIGAAQVVPPGAPVRLAMNAMCPEDGMATVEAVDVAGTGWSKWLGGETITVDGGMVTVGIQYPYFDGNTPDTGQYEYAWLAAVNASPSTRTTLESDAVDPLADPDCPAPPSPPTPPVITDECITEVGVWRRYWVQVPPGEVAKWAATIPTLILTTGSQAAREVRIRVFENPDDVPASIFEPGEWVSEQIVRYMPPNTVLTVDGVSQRVRASVAGATPVAADHLLYGTGGGPASWPILACGIGYLIALDVPLDAALGNLTTDLALTRRML